MNEPSQIVGSRRALNPAQEVELARLIAEQAADDTEDIRQWQRSLDASLTDDGDFSLYEVISEPLVDVGPARSKSGRTTAEQVKEWRALRNKNGWTYQQIADYAGVTYQTVRHHISKGTGERRGSLQFQLEQRFDDLRGMYESGAFLREIAEVVYEEVGFQSWQACYQGLRSLFIRKGVAIRPRDASRRARSGRPAPDAPREEWQRFWRKQNQRAKVRRRALRLLCDASTKGGRSCRNTAMAGSSFCRVHDELTRPKPKWTKEIVLEALRAWAEAHGGAPKAHDWMHAEDGHPNCKTVADLFGRWNYALYEAGLRTRKHPKKKRRAALLADGYKPCEREGCDNLVAPSRRYCRDRRCQDARSTLVVEPRHGTMIGYKIDGCRCDPCTKANTEWQREYRHARQAAA